MNSLLKFERPASLVALRPGGRPQVARPSIFAVLVILLAGINPSVSWANTNQGRVNPFRPVDMSSPFTFQQTLPEIPNDIDRRYLMIDTGGSSTCAIRARDRGIDCWGLNEVGQATPPLNGRFRSLSVGGSVGCALTVNYRPVCWGQGNSQPGPQRETRRYLQLSAGDDHVCAIRASNRAIECWGDNSQGQLNSPRGAFRAISARSGKTCALRVGSGAMECWGDPAFMAYPRPADRFRDVSVGTLHGCAVRADDSRVICWGNGFYGEDLPPVGRFRSVTSGTDHTCGQRTDNTVVCWGRNQWGQTNMPANFRVRSLMAGGMQTCAVDRVSRLLCRGSFAYNGLLYPQLSGSRSETMGDPLAPQFAIVDDIASNMIINFVGDIFTNWGDAAGGGFGDFLLFVGGVLGGSSDKALMAKLQAIQDKLDDLANSLSQLDKKAGVILADIKTLQCDDKLGDLDAAVQNIRAASLKYQGGGELTDTGSYMALVRRELTKAQQAGYVASDLRPSMRQFVGDWQDKVANDMVSIDRVLMNANYKSGPFTACLDRAYMAYQNQPGDKQLDDRRIWKGIYWVIQKAMIEQALGAQMLLDMNKFTALTALSDPAVEPATPVVQEGADWNTATLCADVKAHQSLATGNRRWDQALQACQRIEGVTRQLYRNLVQQVESAGAPYTGKDVILSMGSNLLGTGSSSVNYLWLRSWDFNLFSLGRFDEWSMDRLDMSGRGDAGIYMREGDYEKKGTWRSDGLAWTALYDNMRGVNGVNMDRIAYLADAMSEFDGKPLFNPAVKNALFWMTGQTYRLDWFELSNPSYTGALKKDDGGLDGIKCFVAAELKNVCSTERMSGGWDVGLVKYDAHDNAWKADRLYIGWKNDVWQKYTHRLNQFLVQFYKGRSGWWFEKIIDTPAFFPGGDDKVALERMPVLQVDARDCTKAMVIANQNQPRQGFRVVAGTDGKSRELPSRCGTDLDYFIEKMFPRPDVPDLDRLVRKPVYPQGVN